MYLKISYKNKHIASSYLLAHLSPRGSKLACLVLAPKGCIAYIFGACSLLDQNLIYLVLAHCTRTNMQSLKNRGKRAIGLQNTGSCAIGPNKKVKNKKGGKRKQPFLGLV